MEFAYNGRSVQPLGNINDLIPDTIVDLPALSKFCCNEMYTSRQICFTNDHFPFLGALFLLSVSLLLNFIRYSKS